MTFAEIVLLVAVGSGIYLLLRPIQRWLERYFVKNLFSRHPRGPRRAIDVTHFTSYALHKKDSDHT